MQIFGPDPCDVTHAQILDFLALRKGEFVDVLGWDLPHTKAYEFDQYDLPDARFVIAYSDGKCVGGARILPTDCEDVDFFGTHKSWMLRDFIRSNAGGISDAIECSLQSSSTMWEMTRFVVTKRAATTKILARMNEFLSAQGAEFVLTISPPAMQVVLRRLGYNATRLSDSVDYDGKPYVVLRTKVRSAPA